MINMAAIWTPGTPELIVILVIVLILFGPKNLPKIGGAIGRGIREFKDGLSSMGTEDKSEKTDDDKSDTVQPMKREKPEVLPAGDRPVDMSAEKSGETVDKRE